MKGYKPVDFQTEVVLAVGKSLKKNEVFSSYAATDMGLTVSQLQRILKGTVGFNVGTLTAMYNWVKLMEVVPENVRMFRQGLEMLECHVKNDKAYLESGDGTEKKNILVFWVEPRGRVVVQCEDGKEYYVDNSLMPVAREWVKQCKREGK